MLHPRALKLGTLGWLVQGWREARLGAPGKLLQSWRPGHFQLHTGRQRAKSCLAAGGLESCFLQHNPLALVYCFEKPSGLAGEHRQNPGCNDSVPIAGSLQRSPHVY